LFRGTEITDGKITSSFFFALAKQVLKDNDGAATLSCQTVQKYFNDATTNGKAKSALTNILTLFDSADGDAMIPIIGNSALNVEVESLATILTPYLAKASKSIVVPTILDCFVSY
jgi:hypothetical protein